MSDVQFVALMTAIPATITALGVWWNGRKIQEVHQATNGLVKKIEAAAVLRGASEQREADRNA